VTLGPIVNGLRVVRDGLKEGDIVVVEWLATRAARNERDAKAGADGERAVVVPTGPTAANDDASAKRPGASGK